MDKEEKAFSVMMWLVIGWFVVANWPAIVRFVDVLMHMGPPNGP